MTSDRMMKGSLPRIEWGPVITGVLCAVAIHIVLGLFGTAFGLAARPSDSTGVGIGAGIWGLLVPLVATAIGAFIAVRIASRDDAPGAYLHGTLVWAIGLIAGALFITGTMASGAMTSAAAASGNVRGGLTARQVRGTSTTIGIDDAAKSAAAAAGAGGLGALLGLAGAFIGAAAGRRALTGEGFGMHRGSARGRSRMTSDERLRSDERLAAESRPTTADGGALGARTDVRRGEVLRPGEDPTVHH